MENAVIVSCARTPMTKARVGSFAFSRMDDVASELISKLIPRIPNFNSESVEDVLIGCAMPEGEQGLNVARNISFLAGLPVSAGAVTINRLCASSLEAVNLAAQAVRSGNGELFIAGGIESMSRIPMGGVNPSPNPRLVDGGLPKAYIAMGLTAENLARKYAISRAAQDEFALKSHRKASAAWSEGRFEAEVIAVSARCRDGGFKEIKQDEICRRDTSLDVLSKLPSAFLEGGTVTAGNSSPLTDGAAMVVIASENFAKKRGMIPFVRIRAMTVAGVDPEFMGEGPIDAVPKALARAGMKLSDIDLVELNEAFAVQAIAVIDKLGLDEGRVNVKGGAIALGHPLGASGARIVTTLVHAMKETGVSTGLAAMCVGGGQGVATIFERA